MAVGSPPTVRRRQLGRELRQLREDAGFLAEQLAERLRCSASRISRIEMARIRISPGTVHEILDALGIDGPERGRLVNLAREAEEPGWWQSYTDTLTYEYSTYIALEAEAASLKVFEPIVVYGLLQTEDYARSIIEQGNRRQQPAEVKARLEARLARQEILTRPDAPRVHVVLDESVLHRVIGTPDILRAQLKHLIQLAELPTVTIQVLPFDSGDVLALYPGPIVVIEFLDPSHGAVVYLENIAGDLYVERPAAVREQVSSFERLCAMALSPARSIETMKARSGVS